MDRPTWNNTCGPHDMTDVQLSLSSEVTEVTLSDASRPDAGTSSSESCPKSLLELLRAPQRSELARKCCVAHNLPHDGRRVKTPKRSHDPNY